MACIAAKGVLHAHEWHEFQSSHTGFWIDSKHLRLIPENPAIYVFFRSSFNQSSLLWNEISRNLMVA